MAKILLVEDDNNLREIYEARLQAEGYEIVTAPDGETALVVAKKELPDLVISDVMMPRVSGFEMLDILRNTEGLKHTKVIMLTALGQAEDKTRADTLGADKYLVKSQVTLEDIVKAAKELLGDEVPAPAAEPANTPDPMATTTQPATEPAAAPDPAVTTTTTDPAAAPPTSAMPTTPTEPTPAVQAAPDPMTTMPATTPQPPAAAPATPDPAPQTDSTVTPAADPAPAAQPTFMQPTSAVPAPDPVAPPAAPTALDLTTPAAATADTPAAAPTTDPPAAQTPATPDLASTFTAPASATASMPAATPSSDSVADMAAPAAEEPAPDMPDTNEAPAATSTDTQVMTEAINELIKGTQGDTATNAPAAAPATPAQETPVPSDPPADQPAADSPVDNSSSGAADTDDAGDNTDPRTKKVIQPLDSSSTSAPVDLNELIAKEGHVLDTVSPQENTLPNHPGTVITPTNTGNTPGQTPPDTMSTSDHSRIAL